MTQKLDAKVLEQVLSCTGASAVCAADPVQTLWSGFGQIVRLRLTYTDTRPVNERKTESVIVKLIQPPEQVTHPRGWNSDTSTQRKLKSYQVEANWYQQYADACSTLCTVPSLLASHQSAHQTWLILEDLDVHFPARFSQLTIEGCKPCLQWLARFHAHHYQHSADGLWDTGTYWHLQTRQDEFAAMDEGSLKQVASALDDALNDCAHQTLVHGDAKVANFCFSDTGDKVAMVDFQYAGRGCGMRDVIYFLGSCLTDTQCEQHADALLDVYFAELCAHLPAAARLPVEEHWRGLYAIAWADFNRFLAGWMPEHAKINRYMRAMTQTALAQL